MSMKLPPEPTENYQLWRKGIAVWCKLTDTVKEKRGLALQYACRNNKKLHEAVLNIDEDLVEGEAGLANVLKVLDALHNVDKIESAVECYEKFNSLRRKENQKVADLIIQFETLAQRTKDYGNNISEDLLAYKLLKASNLSETDERIVKAATTEFTLENIKKTLKRTYGETTGHQTEEIRITTEPIYHANGAEGGQYREGHHTREEEIFYANKWRNQQRYKLYNTNHKTVNNSYQFRHGKITKCNICNSSNHYGVDCPDKNYDNSEQSRHNPLYFGEADKNVNSGRNANSQSFSPSSTEQQYVHKTRIAKNINCLRRGKNPMNSNGVYSKCVLCRSIFHWVADCPDHEVFLVNMDLTELLDITAAGKTCCIITSSIPQSVCGMQWLLSYISMLTQDEKLKVTHTFNTPKQFNFRNGKQLQVVEKVIIPLQIGEMESLISLSVINEDIPLLLSRSSLQKMQMTIDPNNDTAEIRGKTVKLNVTPTGVYSLQLSLYSENKINETQTDKDLISETVAGCDEYITLQAVYQPESLDDINNNNIAEYRLADAQCMDLYNKEKNRVETGEQPVNKQNSNTSSNTKGSADKTFIEVINSQLENHGMGQSATIAGEVAIPNEHIGKSVSKSSRDSSNPDLVSTINELKMENKFLRKVVDDLLQNIVKNIKQSVLHIDSQQKDNQREADSKQILSEERKKTGVIAEPMVILDVKPWDNQRDMKGMRMKSKEMKDLLLDPSKLEHLAYSIRIYKPPWSRMRRLLC